MAVAEVTPPSNSSVSSVTLGTDGTGSDPPSRLVNNSDAFRDLISFQSPIIPRIVLPHEEHEQLRGRHTIPRNNAVNPSARR